MSTWDAKVSRIDEPEPGLLSLSFRAGAQHEALVIAILPGTLELGIVAHRPRGAAATPSITKLRRHLEGTRIVGIERSRRAVRLTLKRGDRTRFLVAAPTKPYGAWWLSDIGGAVVIRSPGASGKPPTEDEHWMTQTMGALRDRGAGAYDAHQTARLEQLRRMLTRELKRLRKKREAIRGDLERAGQAATLHEQATILLAHASEIPGDATFFEAAPWDAPNRRIRIELAPGQSPAAQAQNLFEKSKRLRRGLDVAPARLEAVETALTELQRLEEELAGYPAAEAAAALESHGITIVEPRERERRRRRGGTRLPYREFVTEDGTVVLVGRGAADNDRLTLRVARPHDLWLHARGIPGAHVVVRLSKGKSCSTQTLVDAATLAAHFSDLRAESVVEVLYTPRRFVRKRRGSAIGSMTLDREKVMAVRVEPDRLRRLLGSEKKS